MTDDVLIVTVAYRSAGVLPTFLASIPAATRRPTRVVVVNNGPESLPTLTSPAAHVSVEPLETGANLGYGGGINQGAGLGLGEPWLLVANPDLEFEPGSIDELISVAESTAVVGMVGPLIRTPQGEVYPSARRLPSLRHGVGHALLGRVWPTNPWTRGYLADRADPPRRRQSGWLSGSCILLPRAVFDAVEGFDDGYFMYFEDVDLGARIGKAGYAVVYAPSASVVHVGGVSTREASRAMIAAHHRSAYRYLSRRYRAWYLAPLRLVLRAGLGVRGRLVRG